MILSSTLQQPATCAAVILTDTFSWNCKPSFRQEFNLLPILPLNHFQHQPINFTDLFTNRLIVSLHLLAIISFTFIFKISCILCFFIFLCFLVPSTLLPLEPVLLDWKHKTWLTLSDCLLLCAFFGKSDKNFHATINSRTLNSCQSSSTNISNSPWRECVIFPSYLIPSLVFLI